MELCREFAISRQAVREALKVLAAKGLVMSRRRAGTLVLPRSSWNLLDPDVLTWHDGANLSQEFLRDLVELRCIIEPAAADLAATRGQADQVAQIGVALDAMYQTVDDDEAFKKADADFHAAVFVASGNALFDCLSTILRPLLAVSFPLQMSVRPDRQQALALHTEVFRAILAGDAPTARGRMETIVAKATAKVERAIGARLGASLFGAAKGEAGSPVG